MEAPTPLPPGTAAVVVAAGAGLRAGQPLPKQFAVWRGKPVVRHSVEAMAAAGVSPIIVAIPEGAQEIARAALAGIEGVRLVTGGATRQLSVLARCTNRDLPIIMPAGFGRSDFVMEAAAPVEAKVTLTQGSLVEATG